MSKSPKKIDCHKKNYEGFLCPVCEDPANGGECMRNFCWHCLRELGWEAVWGELCDGCRDDDD